MEKELALYAEESMRAWKPCFLISCFVAVQIQFFRKRIGEVPIPQNIHKVQKKPYTQTEIQKERDAGEGERLRG